MSKNNRFKTFNECQEKPSKQLPIGGITMLTKLKNWFKERRPWWSIWVMVLLLMGAGMMFGKCEMTIKFDYDAPPVVQKFLGNK